MENHGNISHVARVVLEDHRVNGPQRLKRLSGQISDANQDQSEGRFKGALIKILKGGHDQPVIDPIGKRYSG